MKNIVKLFCRTNHKEVEMIYDPIRAGYVCPTCNRMSKLLTDKFRYYR